MRVAKVLVGGNEGKPCMIATRQGGLDRLDRDWRLIRATRVIAEMVNSDQRQSG